MRDYSGKKPRTYNTIASTVSQDTQRSKYDKTDRASMIRRSQSINVEYHSKRQPCSVDHKGPSRHSAMESRLDRAKRVGSKRFQSIKKSISTKPLGSPMRRNRPVSDPFPKKYSE